MNSVPFERLFSKSAFEALLAVRRRQRVDSRLSFAEALALVQQFDADAAANDFAAASALNDLIPEDTTIDGVAYFQHCIAHLVYTQRPLWGRILALGRAKFTQKLSRDELQCFRDADLLLDPPSPALIGWWDDLAMRVRADADRERLQRARQAEQASFDYECARLRKLGIPRSPRLVSIEDNTAGYDIHSYDAGTPEPVARLIEVKSTIASPLRFILSRGEWEKADAFGASYHFHIWDFRGQPPKLYECTATQVRPHIPRDDGDGKWKDVVIPLGSL